MPRDQRLYMTFPIDFDEHPKVERLSDNAFRVFVAMNGYSRRQKLDGRIPVDVARKKWKPRSLAELVASHPDRPLVELVDEHYVLRSYEDHQFTTADEIELYNKRAEAGAKGGKAKANALALAKQGQQQNVAGSESGSGSSTDVTTFNESGQVLSARNADSDSLNRRAKLLAIPDLADTRQTLEKTVGQPVTMLGALLLAEEIISKSKKPVGNGGAYVGVTCRNSPAEVQQTYFDMDIGGLAEASPELASILSDPARRDNEGNVA